MIQSAFLLLRLISLLTRILGSKNKIRNKILNKKKTTSKETNKQTNDTPIIFTFHKYLVCIHSFRNRKIKISESICCDVYPVMFKYDMIDNARMRFN